MYALHIHACLVGLYLFCEGKFLWEEAMLKKSNNHHLLILNTGNCGSNLLVAASSEVMLPFFLSNSLHVTLGGSTAVCQFKKDPLHNLGSFRTVNVV